MLGTLVVLEIERLGGLPWPPGAIQCEQTRPDLRVDAIPDADDSRGIPERADCQADARAEIVASRSS